MLKLRFETTTWKVSYYSQCVGTMLATLHTYAINYITLILFNSVDFNFGMTIKWRTADSKVPGSNPGSGTAKKNRSFHEH